jgi:hypothetical protein
LTGTPEVFAHLPQPVVLGVVKRLDVVDVGRDGRDQHAAAQPVLLDPVDVGDRVVDVVEEDLSDPGAPVGLAGAEVGEPPVVRANAREPVLVLVGLRRPREQHEVREERGNRVREHDFTDDAVLLEITNAPVVVPVADPAAVL